MNFDYLFTEEDLYKKIDKYETIKKVNKNLTEKKIIDWFNKLYYFLSENNCKDCFNKYKLIPNENGNLKKIDEIFGNDGKRKYI